MVILLLTRHYKYKKSDKINPSKMSTCALTRQWIKFINYSTKTHISTSNMAIGVGVVSFWIIGLLDIF